MSGRTLGILALIAVIAICGALLVQTGKRAPVSQSHDASSDSALIPGLMDRLDAVATVRIADATGAIVLTKDAAGAWHDTTHGGYPAKAQAVGQLVLALANMDAGEPKTDDPALYAEIGVEDPAPGPNATVVELKDGAGAVLGTVILGKKSERVMGGRFVRVLGTARARQIVLNMNPTPASRGWLEAQILRIPRDRITAISVHPIDAPPIEVERAEADPQVFIVRGFDGPISTDPLGPMSQLTSSIAWLQFEDVRRSAGEPPSESAMTTTYRLREGWGIQIVSWAEGEDRWARIEVLDPSAMPEGEAGAQIAAEVAAVRTAVAGWDFKLYAAQYDTLRPTAEAITAPPAAPASETQE